MTAASLPAGRTVLSHRITEVPIRAEAGREDGTHRIRSALTVAHGADRPVAVAWVRVRPHGPVQVLVGGVEADPAGDEVLLAFPPGARGRRMERDDVDSAMSGLEWEAAQLTLDLESMLEDSMSDRLEDLFALTGRPIGLFVIARPVANADVAARVDTLSDEIVQLEAMRTGRGVHRRGLARAERNLEYYDRSAGVGCWSLEVWTAGSTPPGARVAAALLAGSADVACSPLLLRPAQSDVAGQYSWSGAVVVGSDAVAALARPPFRELPGVRVTPVPDFDQNVEDKIEVRLGAVLDGSRTAAAPFGVSLDSINRHVFVSGATGAGKSETVRTLLWSLNQLAVPWLVIEPAKAEYAALGPWLDPTNPVVIIRPGDAEAPPPMINPLEPSSIVVDGTVHRFPLQTHLDLVKALFIASFDAEEPFPQVLAAGLTGAYQSRGWNLVTGDASDPSLSPPEWPVLSDLVAESLRVVDGLGYAADVRNNMRGFIRVRVESLRSGTPGRFFEGGYPIDLEDMLKRPTVFEIEDLGDDRDKAFFIGSLIIRVVEMLRLYQKHDARPSGLAHVLVIEEAHRLLRRVSEESPSAHAVTMFANLLAEIRSYGEGVVVAEQIPSKVIPDLVKNSAVKLMHRLPAEDDRLTVGATMNLNEEQSAHVVALEPGTLVAHSAGMDRPVLARIERVGARQQTGAGTSAPRLGQRRGGSEDETNRPFTLAELERSRDLVTPAVALWAEQVVVMHLTNDPIGRPQGLWFESLQHADRSLSRCALGLAVAEAIGRRRGLIRRWYDPEALAAATAELMMRQLESGRGIDRPKWRWAVAQFRFPLIKAELRDESTAENRSTPHPLSARWSAAGIDLPGPTWEDQAAQLDGLVRVLPSVRPRELAGSPPVFDELARALGCDGSSEQRRISTALSLLGLEYKRLVVRIGARGE